MEMERARIGHALMVILSYYKVTIIKSVVLAQK